MPSRRPMQRAIRSSRKGFHGRAVLQQHQKHDGVWPRDRCLCGGSR
jgi:hypothetical protein